MGVRPVKWPTTNSWLAQGLYWIIALGMFLLGWQFLVGYIVGSIVCAYVILYNMLRADAVRPSAEWSNEPMNPSDWVL